MPNLLECSLKSNGTALYVVFCFLIQKNPWRVVFSENSQLLILMFLFTLNVVKIYQKTYFSEDEIALNIENNV